MQIKRFGSIILSLLLTLSAASGNATELSTAEDLLQLIQNPGGSFILTKDIDMSRIDWTPVDFTGTLDGNGHIIYNLNVKRTGNGHAETLDGNAKVYDTIFAGFFSTLIDANVENLNFRGVDINIESSNHCFVGVITGYMKNAQIVNCTVHDARASITSTIQPDPANPRTSCNAGIGGIAGFASGGTIRNCTADTVLVFTDKCSSELKVEEFMGGAVSCGNASLLDCNITIDGYDECRGYVHNGGLVGMFYQFDKELETDTINGCAVNGMITFFEDNPDRRAYCSPIIGETMTWPYLGQNVENFIRNETEDDTAKLSPEKCSSPKLTETKTEGDCTNCGYTTHKCTVCGNTWRDSFILPSHTAGEWIVASDPKNGVDGVRRLSCSKCGETLEEEILKAVQKVTINKTSLELNYKDDAVLKASIDPADAADQQIRWRSSNEKVATVNADGTVHAAGRGTATITAESADGFAKGQCDVKVGFSFKQWIIKILLFGWIWY